MGIRQTINEKPGVVTAVTATIIFIALLCIIWQAFGHRSRTVSVAAMKAFYSDDDGKTWFVDSLMKIPPFDHNGKTAYRANVFRCGKTLFVGYLQKFSDAQKDAIEKAAANASGPGSAGIFMMAYEQMTEVKRPGDARWLLPPSNASGTNLAAYQRIFNVTCPAGSSSAQIMQVSPTEADNGATPE